MPESTRQTLPSGPTSLCFNKEEFMRPDFNVELFIVECRRRVQLETLRDDLALYLKILQSAMIELINKDYADFVNLSTNLVGMDKAINTLVTPLDQLKSEIQNVRGALDDAIAAVEVKMTHQAKIRQKKVCLQRLMNIVQSVATMEKLLGIPPPTPTGIPTPPPSPGPHQTKAPSVLPKDDEPSGQLIERVATEFNKLQFYVSKSRSLPMVDQIKPRIANITSTLQFSLEGLFLQGLETSNMPILRQCLRTYATIDKMRNAENLFRKHVVAPFMEEIINEPFIRTHPQGLRGMYAIVLDFIPKHCRCLKEVTAGSPSSGLEPVRGYEFIVNAVWPEVVSNIEAKIPVIFAPGNPNVFHEKYTISVEFVEKLERLCSSQASVKRLRAHPSYSTFMAKWSLPVYFQIRFQEIAGSVEQSLADPFASSADASDGFQLSASSATWLALQQCWQSDVFLAPLSHRFWKLSLQILSRYATWTAQVQKDLDELREAMSETVSLTPSPSSASLVTSASSASLTSVMVENPPELGNGDGSPSSHLPQISMTDVVRLVADIETLSNKVPEFFRSTVAPLFSDLGLEKSSLLEDGISEGCLQLEKHLPQFSNHIIEMLALQCCSHLKTVNDIPRLYRRTNREVPSKSSVYVTSVLQPIEFFIEEHSEMTSSANIVNWTKGILRCISEQYLTVTADVLTSVRKMEESLRRLKRGKGSSNAAQHGMSDDDKIRLQLYLDVQQFGQQISSLWPEISASDIDNFDDLMTVVVNAKKGNSQ